MEDGEAVEIAQNAMVRDGTMNSYIAMCGGRAQDANHLVAESAIIGLWQFHKTLMRIEA